MVSPPTSDATGESTILKICKLVKNHILLKFSYIPKSSNVYKFR